MFYKRLGKSCHSLLDEGVARLDLSIGIVSHIYNGLYTVVAINSEVGGLVTGAVFPLADTYCREVFETGKTLALTEINGVPGMRLHPLYLDIRLEAYLSTPIFHKEKVWGTVNFSSAKLHKPFTQEDRALVEGYALTIGQWLDEMSAPPRAQSR